MNMRGSLQGTCRFELFHESQGETASKLPELSVSNDKMVLVEAGERDEGCRRRRFVVCCYDEDAELEKHCGSSWAGSNASEAIQILR